LSRIQYLQQTLKAKAKELQQHSSTQNGSSAGGGGKGPRKAPKNKE